MARKLRVYLPGAFYHVIWRGNQGQWIFSDDADRRRYLELLQDTRLRFDFRLSAYVLMGNHVHHLIEVGPTPLSTIMHHLLCGDTRHWNQRDRKVGHLFQVCPGEWLWVDCGRGSSASVGKAAVTFLDLVRIMVDADLEAAGLPAPGQGTHLTDGRLAWLRRS